MKRALMIGFAAWCAVSLSWASQAPQNLALKKADPKPILGMWALEVSAGDTSYFLTLEIKLNAGALEGGLSEQGGMFTNAPLANIEFDGQVLKFDVNTPTPPDGAERLIKTEMKLADGKLQGSIMIVDMGMSAPVTGVKK